MENDDDIRYMQILREQEKLESLMVSKNCGQLLSGWPTFAQRIYLHYDGELAKLKHQRFLKSLKTEITKNRGTVA